MARQPPSVRSDRKLDMGLPLPRVEEIPDIEEQRSYLDTDPENYLNTLKFTY